MRTSLNSQFSRPYPTLSNSHEQRQDSLADFASSNGSSSETLINTRHSQQELIANYLTAAKEGDLYSVCNFLKNFNFPIACHDSALWNAANSDRPLVVEALLHRNNYSSDQKKEAVGVVAQFPPSSIAA